MAMSPIKIGSVLYVTAKDIARAVGKKPRTVRSWAHEGRFPRPARRDEGHDLWHLKDVVRALRALHIDVPWSWSQAAG